MPGILISQLSKGSNQMDNKYKICIIGSAHWSAAMGGIEYQEKLLVNELKKRKNIVTYFITSYITKEYKPEGYNIIFLNVNKVLKKYASFFGSIKLLRILREISPDAIYQNGASALIGVAGYYSKDNSCKLIWHVASDSNLVQKKKFSPIKHFYKLIEKKLFEYGIKKADEIVVLTEYQGQLARKINNNKAEIKLIRTFHPFPEKNKHKIKKNQIIWVANFKKLKQPEMFINLSCALYEKKINVNCIMIGAPVSHPPSYQRLLEKKINETPNLLWIKKQPVEIVNKYINESKLLINTSKWEGFPNTYIQAWMRETPVVTLKCDPDGLIKNLKIGMHSGNFDKLIDDVMYLLSNEDLRQKMGKNAKQYALKYHSLQNCLDLSDLIIK